MAGEGADHTLQATALLNEAYLRLVDGQAVRWTDRTHFFAVGARIMRRLLVDHARARRALKRGGPAARVTFDEGLVVTNEPRQDFAALDDAMTALAAFDPRKSRVVELRFFGGLTVEETASMLNVSSDTVMRDWRLSPLSKGTAPVLAVRPDGRAVPLPQLRTSAQGGGCLRFLPDGRLVYSLGPVGKQARWLLDLSTKEWRQLARLPGDATMSSFDVTPDGKHIVFDRRRELSDIVLIELVH
jgi:RNA polymerase sigma factor (TIGR02999 family)